MPDIPLGTVVGPQGPQGPKGDTGTFSPEDLQRITDLEAGKVDKITGKGLSTNDYTDADKSAVATVENKVDKIAGKGLSTNDYTDADKNAVATIGNKVDKVTGKGLSTNDYTTAEKNKLSGIEAQANKTVIDTTLSNAGQAADAKKTGDKFAVLCDYLRRMESYCEASGNPATFSDAKAASVKALSVTITPTQSGSGDPSPANIRPISGVSSVTVTRSGENGANSQSVTVALTDSSSNPLTVYGGTLNVTTGELTVTHAGVNLGGLSWNVGAATTGYYYSYALSGVIKPPATNNDIADILCEAYPAVTLEQVFGNRVPLGIAIQTTPSTGYVAIRDRNKTNLSAADFAATLSGVTLVYPLKTPVTYQLTPAQLATLHGYNAISSNAGPVAVTYKADANIILGGG